jgi:hypothetical protein
MRRVTYVKKIVVLYPREKKTSERQMKNNIRKYIQGHIDCYFLMMITLVDVYERDSFNG